MAAKKPVTTIGSIGGISIQSDKRVITGDRELDRNLAALGDKVARKVSAQALNKGLTVIAKEIQKAAVDMLDWTEASPSTIKKAVGKRFAKAKTGSSRGLLEAKAGIHVGPAKKARRNEDEAWWLHFFGVGTMERFQRSGKYVGRIEENDFVGRGFDASKSSAEAKIRESLKTGIEREAKKL